MYLTAHHVTGTQSDGINAFLYLHGSEAAVERARSVPDQSPGQLVAQSISVHPGGNRVRSYLDIVAPDDVPWNEVRVALMDVVGTAQTDPLPWVRGSGRCSFRLGLDLGLAPQWHRELAVLYRAAQALRLAHPIDPTG